MTKDLKIFITVIFCFLFFPSLIASTQETSSEPNQNRLLNDLLVVDYWNRKLSETMPTTYNHLLQGGYFAMPSARMGNQGELGFGYADAPPYRNYNLRCQILSCLEITANYRIFHKHKDPVLSPYGYGDFSDRGINFKLALIRPEDSDFKLPGIAIGYEDFIGTSAFKAKYAVLTKVFLKQNLELSLGYGTQRIKGFFGGVNWIPFRKCDNRFLSGLNFSAEYDPTPYKRSHIEKHPKGRVKKSPINFGIKYRLLDVIDLSISRIRGKELAFSLSASYNFGDTKGFLPKIDDPLPYRSPLMIEPLGLNRPEGLMVQELIFAFQEQGLAILDIFLTSTNTSCNRCEKGLRINLVNDTFRLEAVLRERLNALLAGTIPSDIETVAIVVFSEGFPIQQYTYNMEFVHRFASSEICPYELKLLTPLEEVQQACPNQTTRLFSTRQSLINIELAPRTYALFGSSTGKFKYSLGLQTGFNGFLPGNIYYNIVLGLPIIGNLKGCSDFDRLNRSQLINVHSDIIRYYQQQGLICDQAYLQKTWALGKSWYGRLGTGYFDIAYAGGAAELLYTPVNSSFAFGFQGAVLKKRNYSGLGFTDKIRKFKGSLATYQNFLGSQLFFNLYYDWKEADVNFKITAGKFLANDVGIRYEISKYFRSGLRITLWYTRTNGHDKINGSTYYDKGILFTLPYDIFYTRSERTLWNYAISPWLRDVGFQAYTGVELYELINDQRQ